MAQAKVIELAGQKYSADWLRSVPMNQAVAILSGKHDKNQVINAWKQANGKSVRNHTKGSSAKAKKTTAKKATK